VELAAKGEFGGAPAQSFDGAEVDEIGVVVGLGDMGEDEEARAGVEAFGIGEKFADDVIREMAGAGHDALLDVPGIRANLEHFEIVIGFEDEAITFAEMMLDEFREIAEVGDDGELRAVGAKGVGDRIGGVVRNGEGRDFDVADGEALARTDVLDAIDFFGDAGGKEADDFAMRRFGEIGGGAPVAEKLRQAAGVIGMLVGNEDGVEAIGRDAQRGEAAERFLAAEAGVHEKAGALGFEQRGIARTAGSEDGDSQ
jgi:hypothetical protein